MATLTPSHWLVGILQGKLPYTLKIILRKLQFNNRTVSDIKDFIVPDSKWQTSKSVPLTRNGVITFNRPQDHFVVFSSHCDYYLHI
jgi:hypothetical protein